MAAGVHNGVEIGEQWDKERYEELRERDESPFDDPGGDLDDEPSY